MTGTDAARTRGTEPLLLFLFLSYLVVACFVLGPFTDINSPKWFIIRAGGPLLFAAAWFQAGSAGRRFVQWDPIAALAVTFLVLNVVSLAVATNIGYGLERIASLAGLIATYFVAAYLCRDPRARTATLWMLVTIGAATSAYGIAQHFGYDFFPWREASEVPVDRGVSFFGHATFTASVLIQIIPIAVAMVAASGRAGTVAATVAALAMLYHLSFTGARMATLAFLASTIAAGIAWIVLRRRDRGATPHVLRTLVAMVAIVGIGAAAGGWFVVRAWQAKDSDLFAIRQSSLALRLYNWETASRMIYANPALGVGAGNYEIVSPRYWGEVEQLWYARNGRWMQQAHNDYLQTAAELGLPGVALLLGLFAYAVVMALHAAARAPGRAGRWTGLALFAAVAALAIDANTTFSLQVPGSALVLWVVLALISASHAAREA